MAISIYAKSKLWIRAFITRPWEIETYLCCGSYPCLKTWQPCLFALLPSFSAFLQTRCWSAPLGTSPRSCWKLLSDTRLPQTPFRQPPRNAIQFCWYPLFQVFATEGSWVSSLDSAKFLSFSVQSGQEAVVEEVLQKLFYFGKREKQGLYILSVLTCRLDSFCCGDPRYGRSRRGRWWRWWWRRRQSSGPI